MPVSSDRITLMRIRGGLGLIRILITGSRDWSDFEAVKRAINDATADFQPWDIVIIHGNCPTGADKIADEYGKQQGFSIESYPADWSKGRKAGPLRNQQMVDRGADICLAFPQGKSYGTRGCMKMAERAGIPVRSFEV